MTGEKQDHQEDPDPSTIEVIEKEAAPVSQRRLRTILFRSYLLIAIAGFAFLTYLASTRAYTGMDLSITRLFQAYDSMPVEYLMRGISWAGYLPQAAFVAGVLLLLLWLSGWRWEAKVGLLSVLGVEGLNLMIKLAVQRPRPTADLVEILQVASGYSFPSGHVMFYVGLFGFLTFLVYTLLRGSWKRTVLIVLFGCMVILVGFSRVYLGDHWASDVLGGYLAGSLWLVLMIEVYRRWKPGLGEKKAESE